MVLCVNVRPALLGGDVICDHVTIYRATKMLNVLICRCWAQRDAPTDAYAQKDYKAIIVHR